MNKKKVPISAVILTLLMTFMEMTGIPCALFLNIHILDINPIYFALMLNFIIAFIICWLWKRFLCKEWSFGLHKQGVVDGCKKYTLPVLIATILVAIAFCVGLVPFDNTPTALRVIIEGIVYYIGVAIMEELYLRGLLQNILEKCLGNRKNASLYAVLIASVLFGLGHIFGALSQPVPTIICKTIWAIALGVCFGAVYVNTRNLWVPIILHFIINLCGIPFCFSTSTSYPTVALITCLVLYSLLAIYSLHTMLKKKA